MKGVLAPSEADAIRNAAPDAELQILLEALARKGVVSAADLSAAGSSAAVSPACRRRPQPGKRSPARSLAARTGASGAEVAPSQIKPPGPTVMAAIAPLRVLPVDPPVKDGLKAAFTMGPVKMTPYGFLKSTAVYDTSNPNGDDMPFPGLFLATPTITSTGPTKDPNFHLKARSARIGANFEWPDIASKLTLTGRLEGDFEGNFTEVNNRDVSSIRSSQFSIPERLGAYGLCRQRQHGYLLRGRTGLDSVRIQRAAKSSGNHCLGILVRRHLRAFAAVPGRVGAEGRWLAQFQDCSDVCHHDANQQPDRKARIAGRDGSTRSGRARGR